MTTEMLVIGTSIIGLVGGATMALLVEATRRHLAGVRLEHAVRRTGGRPSRP